MADIAETSIGDVRVFNTGRRGFPYAAATLVALLLVWQVATALLNIPAFLLPSPLAIAAAVARHWQLLVREAGVTTCEILLGFGLSIAVGVPLAVLLTYSRSFERALYPLIVGSQTI